jgi:import inner membrane translocase subunit TIM10
MAGWFGGGATSTNDADRRIQEQKMAAAQLEIEVTAEMFSKMTNLCFTKCVGKFHDEDLNVGEMSCVDRCVGKYLDAQNFVGKTMQEFQAQQQAAQQMQQQ